MSPAGCFKRVDRRLSQPQIFEQYGKHRHNAVYFRPKQAPSRLGASFIFLLIRATNILLDDQLIRPLASHMQTAESPVTNYSTTLFFILSAIAALPCNRVVTCDSGPLFCPTLHEQRLLLIRQSNTIVLLSQPRL